MTISYGVTGDTLHTASRHQGAPERGRPYGAQYVTHKTQTASRIETVTDGYVVLHLPIHLGQNQLGD